MFKWFKKYFIPHKINNFRPHLLRETGATLLFSIVIMLFILAVSGRFILSRIDMTALVLPKVLVDYANDDRALEKFHQLKINPVLEKAAQLKANDMAERGYFAHKSPDGKTPWYWFKEAGYDFSYAGENLAVNFDDSVDVNKAWMNSPSHRANIMNGNFTEIGIATADGFYQGRKTVFVVQLFGRPSDKTVSTGSLGLGTTTQTKKVTENKPTTPTSPTSQIVLSESISEEVLGADGQSELFIAVEKKSAPIEVATSSKYSSFYERLIVSPSKFLKSLYLIVSILIIFAILSGLLFEFRKHNLRMIIVLVGILFIILGLLFVYKHLLFADLLVV